MSAADCPMGIKLVLRLLDHFSCITRTTLGAVAHLTRCAKY